MLVNIKLDMKLIEEKIERYTNVIKSNERTKSEIEILTNVVNKLQKVTSIENFITPINNGIYYGYWEFYSIRDYCGLKVEQFDSFNYMEKYPENFELWNKSRKNYGTADTIEQVLNHYPELADDNEKYFIIYHDILRAKQSETGAFRYHKNGAYIGIQKPTHEYLYDDIHIDKIIIYHIYKIIE